MTSLRTKWDKGLRTWRLRRQARALRDAARARGRAGPACLVTNLAQMGDVVLSAGVAAALRERLPDSPLLFAAQPRWLEVLADDPALDGLLGVQSLYELRGLAQSGLFETVYALDIPIPNLLDYLKDSPNIFRYGPPTTGDWFICGKNLMALYEQNAGLPEGTARPRVWVRPEDYAFAEQLWRREGLPVSGTDRAPVFALHTQSSMPAKNWPLDHFAALVSRRVASQGARFVVVGGPGEAAALAGMPGVTHLAGQLTIKQTAAVLSLCDFFVGPEGGLAYVAEAMGLPGLVLLGATVQETSGPRSPLFSYIRAPDACHPACHRACTRPVLCINSLTVEYVDGALTAAWEWTCGSGSNRRGETPACASL